ncbi:hypothetical protein EK21DRAFT_66707 [Setomelanomma holmii]|uniref:C3H1-type domain-containing protein n=1 Tax=Setomelanomma holmii TaxID=210430 RepID=A0A9P4LK55_9PLEO|nr:hypothetical protein EK21DRAFT_66707 [Setomelanomma holmii]
MADFSSESPLAVQLQHLVQPKLAEFGWTTGGDDTTLFDYIMLMLANDKNESQVAQELSSDLLDLGPENTETQQFAQWLFEQIEVLKRQLNGGSDAQTAPANDDQMNSVLDDGSAPAQDTEMEGAGDGANVNIPTGPKSMRAGSGSQSTRGARGGRNMLGQINRSMNRNDDPLHRVRGAGGGIGRVNAHAGGPPKGPRGQNIGRGIEAMANGRGMGNASVNMGQNMNGLNAMPMGGMPGMPGMPQMGNQNGMPGMLNPQQQMALMQMYEQQAQMMQQIFSGAAPTGFVNPNFSQNNRGGPKKSLQQRMDRPLRGGMNASAKSWTPKKEGQDEAMADGAAPENGDSMDVESSRPDPSSTMCRFNLRCTNADCPYVHQSPAAPAGTPVDMNDTCGFGVACKNSKCVGKHPSPAQRQKFQSEQECAFWPNCRDPENCPYKHPTERPCRNGGDCTKPDCPYYHTTIKCKFNPCLNPRCTFKHEPGQKKNTTNKWVANKEGGEKEHVSERKFVDENMPEEPIIPGQAQMNESVDVQS